MQTIEEYKEYTRQLEGEVGKWHHAYDALMVERNQLAREHEHLFELTEAQQRFFDEKKERVSNLPEDATDREKELAKIALFMANYAENLQKALNRVKAERTEAMERTAAMERHKHSTDFSKAWGAMVACYRAIDRHFGDEIRALLEKNDRTQKEGQMRALMEKMQQLTK